MQEEKGQMEKMLKRINPCLVLSLVIVGSAAMVIAAAGDWTMYRGPAHNGISKETGWFDASAGVKVLWKKEVGRGMGAIAVGGGRAYVMGNSSDKDTVFCFNAKTGDEVWKFTYDSKLEPKLHEGGPTSTPTIDGDVVYTVSKHGQVHCLTADKGTKKWGTKLKSKKPGWGFAGSPLVVGKLLILNAGPAGTALDKATGKVVWSSGGGAGGYATPVPMQKGGKTHVLLFTFRSVVLVSVEDGKKVWESPWKTKYDINAADPIVVGSNVFISSGYGSGCTLVPLGSSNPTPVWRNKNMRNHMSGCVVSDGHAYGFDESKLTCLDLKTGKKKWTEGSLGKGALMMSDGKLIALSEKGKLVIAAASPDGFKALSSGQVFQDRIGPLRCKCWTVPVLSNGLVYARNAAGEFVCVKVK